MGFEAAHCCSRPGPELSSYRAGAATCRHLRLPLAGLSAGALFWFLGVWHRAVCPGNARPICGPLWTLQVCVLMRTGIIHHRSKPMIKDVNSPVNTAHTGSKVGSSQPKSPGAFSNPSRGRGDSFPSQPSHARVSLSNGEEPASVTIVGPGPEE